MASRDPLNTVIRHQVFLEGLKAGTANDVKATLAELEGAIKDVLDAVDVPTLDKLTKKGLQKLLRDLRVAQGRVMTKALDQLMGELEKIAESEADFEKKLLVNHSQGVTIASVAGSDVFKAALTDPIGAVGDKLEPFLQNWSEYEIKAVSDLVSRGFSEGLTNSQLFQMVRGTKAANYKDGILARMDANVEAVVHTSVQQVASTARMATMEANADIIEGYRIIATLDGKTTPLCRSLDQRVFEINKGPKTPLHIRCRSTMVPELGAEWAFLDKGATRSAQDGPVPAETTYYEWLKTQPAGFQDEALGKKRAALFREGGLSAERFAQLNLGRNFEPRTLAEMKKLEPLAFERADVLQSAKE